MDLSLATNTMIDDLEPTVQRCICCGSSTPTEETGKYFIIGNPHSEFYKDAVCAKCAHNLTCWKTIDV